MDIQFITETSLALAHYVTGYVTKAERSNLQQLWQEVGSNEGIYIVELGALEFAAYALVNVHNPRRQTSRQDYQECTFTKCSKN